VVPCAMSCGLSYPGSAGSSGAFMTPVPPSGLFPRDSLVPTSTVAGSCG
jgi:hypothetical protein